MIAIGGALGTGLLIGTGSALRAAGPAAIFISYSVIGFVVYMVLNGLGEVATHIPWQMVSLATVEGTLTKHLGLRVDGHTCSWSYWLQPISWLLEH